MLPNMFDTQGLAQELDVTPTTLEHWRATGRGPAYVRIGHKVRYRLEDVERWLADNRVETNEGVVGR